MKINSFNAIDLEDVNACPACSSSKNEDFLHEVADYTFNCSDNKWDFSKCIDCQSIFLKKRLNESSIGKAYCSYYTHINYGEQPINKLINIIKKFISKLFHVRKQSFLLDIERECPGEILDLGCGNGDLLDKLDEPGWKKTGIEFDKNAAKEASKKGLKVYEGGYKILNELSLKFDIIVVSHVLEHVHNPRELITLSIESLNSGGEIWMQWPNPESDLLKNYKNFWRGLEAPRHICLMSKKSIMDFINLNYQGEISIIDHSKSYKNASVYMHLASKSIKKGSMGNFSRSEQIIEYIKYFLNFKKSQNSEFCTFVIKKL